MKGHHFKEGEEVAHKEMLAHKMIVRKIVRKVVTIPGTQKTMDKFIGLECAWWNEQKKYVKQIFHSRELVPWDIALKGREEVVKFLTGEAGSNGDNTLPRSVQLESEK